MTAADKDNLRNTLSDAKSQRSQAMQSAGMTAAFIAPMVTSSLAQSGVIRQEGADLAGGLAMGAGMGAMFGPAGMAVGAALGGGMALPKFIDSFSDESKEAAKSAEMAAEKLNKFNSSTQNYIKTLTNFSDALLDTSGKFSPQDLIERQEDLQAALMEIPQEFITKFSTAQGSVEEIQKIFGGVIYKYFAFPGNS